MLRYVKINHRKASHVFQANYSKTFQDSWSVWSWSTASTEAPNATSCSRAWASPHFKGATWPMRCSNRWLKPMAQTMHQQAFFIESYLYVS